jgi:uncharacterized coiled-coil protein SlyX
MYSLLQLKTLASCGREPARSLPLWRGFLLIPLMLVCLAFSLSAQAAPSPETPDPGSVGDPFGTADGKNALKNVSGGVANSAFGWYTLFADTTGNFNTALGAGALVLNNADSNTAVGTAALILNTVGAGLDTGKENTAVGTAALVFNSGGPNNFDGSFNGAVGAFALNQNTIGAGNNAFGNSALFSNIDGSENTAIGDVALTFNIGTVTTKGEGSANTAVGGGALYSNTSGSSNDAVGFNALQNNTVGLFNQALGSLALASNVDGASNIAIGDSAFADNVSGSFNTVIGDLAGGGVEGDDNIYIGATSGLPGGGSESGTIRIGDPTFVTACFIAGINGVAVTGTPVVVDANGQLGVAVSSARFKENVQPMDKASESILSLKPVTFRYKKSIDAKGTPQFGLLAEEVAKVNPDLVIYDRDGKPYTVRYEAVNAMLLNEFLKEHHTVQDLKATVAKQGELIAKQQEAMGVLTAQLKEQAAQIQKVSAQLEVRKPAPRVVENR